ncbi:uncharacterized protein J3R85_016669 [Psidium guajava]|nr:uncharacterized protein J3R85_016669 [Psidium guajava]
MDELAVWLFTQSKRPTLQGLPGSVIVTSSFSVVHHELYAQSIHYRTPVVALALLFLKSDFVFRSSKDVYDKFCQAKLKIMLQVFNKPH